MILVAGGTGLIGSAAVRRLVARGKDVAVMTRDPGRSRERIERAGARAVEGDLLRPETLEPAVRGADVVLGAATFPTFPVEKPGKGYTFDAFDGRGTELLVAAAAAAGARRFVYCSGVGAAADARQPWYRAKWRGEEAVRGSGLEAVVVRPSWVYGPADIALNKFVAFHRRLPVVPVVGDGRQRLQPVYVEDVGEALALAAEPGAPTGTFEIGGPEVLTMDAVLGVMMEVRGRRKPLVHLPPALPKLAGLVLQALPRPPLSPRAVDFATADAVAETGPLLEAFPLRLTPLREGLSAYLSP